MMLASVDLNQLSNDLGQIDAVLGSELLGSQRRPKSAYVDLGSFMAWSAVASSSRLLLGRLKRLEIKPTGPAAAHRRATLRICLKGTFELGPEADILK
jgi:hypothetical protein